MWSAVECAHEIIGRNLHEGAIAFDATAGNGLDTLFLLRTVGLSGRVLATDIQAQAIEATQNRTAGEQNFSQLKLYLRPHDQLDQILMEEGIREINCAMFNLGYLPGGDKSVITQVDSTISALAQAIRHLAVDGVITVVAYSGHEGGSEETRAVEEYFHNLSGSDFEVSRFSAPGKANAPQCFAIQRKV